jgi:hypothetical protein
MASEARGDSIGIDAGVEAGPEAGGRRFGALADARYAPLAIAFGLALVGLAARLAWIAYADFTPTFRDDAGAYHVLGQALAAGGGYKNLDGTPMLFWPPGYPFLLGGIYKAFDGSLNAALAANAIFGALAVALTYAIGRRAFDARVAAIGALLFAVYPGSIFLANTTLTEVTFTLLLMLVLWLFVESYARNDWRLLVPAGLIIGYAALVRGHALLLPLVAVPFWFAATSNARGAALRAAGVLALAAIVVAPWTVRNYRAVGEPVLIASSMGPDLFIGHSERADGRFFAADELFVYPELPQDELQARINRDGTREAIEYALRHPLREVELAFRKVYYLYYSDHDTLLWNDGHGEHRFLSNSTRNALSGIADLYYWGLLALAALAFSSMLSPSRPARLLLVSVVVYWTLLHVAFFGEPRFHAPIMPIVCLWAGAGVMRIASMMWRNGPAAGSEQGAASSAPTLRL